MKKILAVVLLFMAVTRVEAQKCDFEKDETDPFTKEHVRTTQNNFGTSTKFWALLFDQVGSKYYITINMAELGKFDSYMPKGNKMLIKLEDGTILETPTEADIIPSSKVFNMNINTNWLVKCIITTDQLKKLSASPIESIRIKMSDRDYDAPEMKSKQSAKIMRSAGCMLSAD